MAKCAAEFWLVSGMSGLLSSRAEVLIKMTIESRAISKHRCYLNSRGQSHDDVTIARPARFVSFIECNNPRRIQSLTVHACNRSTELMPSIIITAGNPKGRSPDID